MGSLGLGVVRFFGSFFCVLWSFVVFVGCVVFVCLVFGFLRLFLFAFCMYCRVCGVFGGRWLILLLFCWMIGP